MIERHIITGEYPPDMGGVAGYTAVLAAALANCGERVHVWCPGAAGAFSVGGVTVHRELRELRSADLRRVSAALDETPRRLLVQWVPHAFGRRSMNLAFCRWLRDRAAAGDQVEVIVHEPFLPFRGGLGTMAAAAVHRVMVMVLLRAATRVWVVTRAWESLLRRYAPARDLGFHWLPVPSTMPIATRAVRPAGANGFVIGSFVTGGQYAEDTIRESLLPLLASRSEVQLLLLGRGSETLRAALTTGERAVASRIHATGLMPLDGLSQCVLGCDAAAQPYPDGLSGRRTTAMAFLAHGRPLVTTDGCYTEDIWRGGAVGLVSSATPSTFANAIEPLIDNAAERERLGKAGRELYDSQFDGRHVAAALHAAAS